MTSHDAGLEPAQAETADPETADPATSELERAELDLMPLAGRLALINRADAAVPALVAAAAPQVAELVERAVVVLHAGGRVVYLGAGSAGRIAALDAAEVGPTYGVEGAFVAVVAGGAGALCDATEGLEDDEDAAAADLAAAGLGAADLLVAVSASGSTPYTRAGLAHGRARGAVCAAVVCAAGSPMAREADLAVVVPVGPEVVEGSTRLAAGTAQKLVLNQLSTLAMVGLGHVYGNLMIGVRAENAKLRARARRAVASAAGAEGLGAIDEDAVDAALAGAGGEARVALVMLRLGVDTATARARLAAVAGDVRAALGERDQVPAPRLRTAPRVAGTAVGVDVGGTKIAAGLVDGSGHVCVRSELPTPRTPDELDRALVAAVAAVRPGPDVPVGVATAGLVDPVAGVVTGVNVPWVAHPLRDRLSALLGGPVAVGNDADAAAWAEYRFGAGRGADSVVLLTIGTGLGGGFVLRGRPVAGAHGLAAEVGHVCLVAGGRPCPCGLSGCWERYTSGSALAAEAARLGPAWLPADRAAVGPAAVAAARAGDPVAVELLAEQGRRLGQGIAMLTSLLDPDVVVVGGGMATLGELLLAPARAALAEGVSPALPRTLPSVVLAALGNEAGVVGAADLARGAPVRPPG
jgi:N-acetylmuramic acid 6-phosphate etherase